MSKSINGLTQGEIKEIEAGLKSRGFVKADQFSKLVKGEYKVTWRHGSAEPFGSDAKFNIEWQE